MTDAPLAAILFDRGDIDGFLAEITDALTKEGRVVRGALQTRGIASGECHCADMDLTTIGSNRTFRISQTLGNGSRGCRLHPGALADCSSFLSAELAQGADLLILNRFGRGESEGRGFRDLIAVALANRTPVLTAVRPTYLSQWQEFCGGQGKELRMDRAVIQAWLADQLPLKVAA